MVDVITTLEAGADVIVLCSWVEQSADEINFYDFITKLEHLTDQVLAIERSLIEVPLQSCFMITIMNKVTIIFFGLALFVALSGMGL